MIIERLLIESFGTNCYIVADETSREAVIIDPGDDADKILKMVSELELKVKYIVLTHGHPDHVGAVADVKEATEAELAMHPDDVVKLHSGPAGGGMFQHLRPVPEPDILLNDGDTVIVTGLELKVIHTPGHSPGGICLFTDGVLFSGDTLFAASIGRSDFPGGDHDQLINSIKTRLLTLPDETAVLPGHMDTTTIGREKQINPFL